MQVVFHGSHQVFDSTQLTNGSACLICGVGLKFIHVQWINGCSKKATVFS